MNDNLHIIGEAGTNHNGSREMGEKLIDCAVEAGADSFKVQVIYPEGLYLPEIWQENGYRENEVYRMRQRWMLSNEEFRSLAEYSPIPFSASVFDTRGLDLLDELDAPYIKIASTDLNNEPFLREAAERSRKLIVSTGMSSLQEVEQAVSAISSAGNEDIVLLHCVSVYPCPTERMNLGFLSKLKTFGYPIGLSDHTEENLAGAIAVGMGASWIEKHFTLDRSQEGFDHVYAMEPEPFKRYVHDLRKSKAACLAHEDKVGPEELEVRNRARRSLYAARELQPGTVVRESDVLIVRPPGPLPPSAFRIVLGQTVRRTIHRYEALTLEALERTNEPIHNK